MLYITLSYSKEKDYTLIGKTLEDVEDEPVAKKQHMQQPASAFPTHQGIYINEQGKQVQLGAIIDLVNNELGGFEQEAEHFPSRNGLQRVLVCICNKSL